MFGNSITVRGPTGALTLEEASSKPLLLCIGEARSGRMQRAHGGAAEAADGAWAPSARRV